MQTDLHWITLPVVIENVTLSQFMYVFNGNNNNNDNKEKGSIQQALKNEHMDEQRWSRLRSLIKSRIHIAFLSKRKKKNSVRIKKKPHVIYLSIYLAVVLLCFLFIKVNSIQHSNNNGNKTDRRIDLDQWMIITNMSHE